CLQRSLRLALLRENQEKQQVAAVLLRIAYLDKYLNRLESNVRAAIEKSYHDVGSLEAEAHRQSVVPTMTEKRRIEGLLVEEKEGLELRQRELVHLARRRRSLESLRERRAAEFRVVKNRDDQKKQDDWMTTQQLRTRL